MLKFISPWACGPRLEITSPGSAPILGQTSHRPPFTVGRTSWKSLLTKCARIIRSGCSHAEAGSVSFREPTADPLPRPGPLSTRALPGSLPRQCLSASGRGANWASNELLWEGGGITNEALKCCVSLGFSHPSAISPTLEFHSKSWAHHPAASTWAPLIQPGLSPNSRSSPGFPLLPPSENSRPAPGGCLGLAHAAGEPGPGHIRVGSNPRPGPGWLLRQFSRRRLGQAGLGGMGSLPSSFSGDPHRDFPWTNMKRQKGRTPISIGAASVTAVSAPCPFLRHPPLQAHHLPVKSANFPLNPISLMGGGRAW